MDKKAMYNLSYGLFVLTAKEGEKDNGCIVNTVAQVTTSPNRISVAVNKANYTHDMILRTGVFNASILSTDAPFWLFEHFGFKTGREEEKIKGYPNQSRAENQVVYIDKFANAYISGKVVDTMDLGSHTLFIADVTDASVLSQVPSVTYSYYQSNIKPKPEKTDKSGWRCKVCGYVYEGDPLPEDFICPLCKHGADDFEKI